MYVCARVGKTEEKDNVKGKNDNVRSLQRGGLVCYLINMIEFEVFEEQQQQSRDGLDEDFFVTVHINSQLHALKDCDTGGHTHTQAFRSPIVYVQL